MSGNSAVVHVVDDDGSFRTAISRLLRAAGYEVRAYQSAGDFLLREQDDLRGCLLLDLRMPGPNGLDLQTALAKRGNQLPIVFLTGHGDVSSSVRAMKAGASDFLEKPVKRDALLGAVRAALARQEDQRAGEEERRVLRQRFESLSAREREVLELVVAGRLNKQISAQIGISERTVKAHRASCMVKMGAGSVAELARAIERLERPQPHPTPSSS